MFEKSQEEILLDKLADTLFSPQTDIEALDMILAELEQLTTAIPAKNDELPD